MQPGVWSLRFRGESSDQSAQLSRWCLQAVPVDDGACRSITDEQVVVPRRQPRMPSSRLSEDAQFLASTHDERALSDMCADAFDFGQQSSWTVINYTLFATGTAFSDRCFGMSSSAATDPNRDVWFTVIGRGGRLLASMCNPVVEGSFGNPQLGIYKGNDCSSLIALACAGGNCGNYGSFADIETIAGERYYIQVRR